MNRNEMFAAIIRITGGRCRLIRHNKSKHFPKHYYIYKGPSKSERAEVVAYGWTLDETWESFIQWLKKHKMVKVRWWDRYVARYQK